MTLPLAPLYLPVKKAAIRVGIPEARLREWIADGLPIYRPPGRTALVRLADLDKYIQKYRVDIKTTDDMVDSILRAV